MQSAPRDAEKIKSQQGPEVSYVPNAQKITPAEVKEYSLLYARIRKLTSSSLLQKDKLFIEKELESVQTKCRKKELYLLLGYTLGPVVAVILGWPLVIYDILFPH